MKILGMGLPKQVEKSSRDIRRELEREVARLQDKLKMYIEIGANKHKDYMIIERNKVDEHVKKMTVNNLDKARDEAVANTFNSLAIVLTVVLHDKLNFGQKRINKILDHVNENFKSIEAGEVSLADFAEEAKRIGMQIEVENG
jgi:hypothetical protein